MAERGALASSSFAALALAAALASHGCATGGQAAQGPSARPLPACASCHEEGPRLQEAAPGLCRRCHASAHGGARVEAAKEDTAVRRERAPCLVCHDTHAAHGQKGGW